MTAEPSDVHPGVHLGPYEAAELLGRNAPDEPEVQDAVEVPVPEEPAADEAPGCICPAVGSL